MDPDGQTTRFELDALGRQRAQQDPDGSLSRWHYGPDGQLASHEQGHLRQSGRVLSRTTLTWTPLGQPAQVLDAVGGRTRWTYDPAGRVQELLDGQGQTTRFTWNEADDLVEQVGIDGLRQRTTPDVMGWPVAVAQGTSEEEAATELHFERDLLGRLLVKRTRDTLTRYRHDAAGQLLAVTRHARLDRPGDEAAYSTRSRTPFRSDGGQHYAVMADSVPV